MTSKYSKNYIEALRLELLEMVEERLSPLALKYRYSEFALEANIKWKPVVLVLGNYSSGKSTLINEFLGLDIQDTGQAPTDDAFTVISFGDEDEVAKQATRDGSALLNDRQYPFGVLKKHGDRFKSHFRMKKVTSPLLENLAIIDTPGMLDSVSERDRGYDYQQVVGDLAQIADLVLVLFDPHKAGTVQETYYSLRETLPAKTFEDRVIFVLNRIDECGNLSDLLRVYGTLCWNLSQMTGRKDIPKILLTYSSQVRSGNQDQEYLKLLDNQRSELLEYVKNAPKHRLDHLASFAEMHGERMSHMLEAVQQYLQTRRSFYFKYWTIGGVFCTLIALGLIGYFQANPIGEFSLQVNVAVSLGVGFALFLLWMLICKSLGRVFGNRLLANPDLLTDLKTQARKDSWAQVRIIFVDYMQHQKKLPSLRQVKKDLGLLKKIVYKSTHDTRTAINNMNSDSRVPEE